MKSKPKLVPRADRHEGEDLWQRYKAKRGIWSEKMLMALDRGFEGNKWFSLIDKIWRNETLVQAWAKTRSNAGACGVDGVTVARFEKDSQTRLLRVSEQLRKQRYKPQPVKRVWIDKAGSREKRPLGIPTVTDRVVQQALRMVIEPIFEASFNPNSYGFRPGRGCKGALREVERLLFEHGRLYVVDIDIKGYFDAIPHERLMDKVGEKIADGRVLKLIESFLKSGVMSEIVEDSISGTPQGGVISPLLANIYLNDLDWQMSNLGMTMIRYADDMVILCTSEEEARHALTVVSEWMEKAQLTLHPQKTRIVNMHQPEAYFDFLGYRFKRSKNSRKLIRLARPKSENKFRSNLRRITRRSNGRSMEEIIKLANPKLRGWFNYFNNVVHNQYEKLDKWLRMRLRSILRKRRKRKGRGRGKDHVRWPNSYFDKLGLFSLEQTAAR